MKNHLLKPFYVLSIISKSLGILGIVTLIKNRVGRRNKMPIIFESIDGSKIKNIEKNNKEKIKKGINIYPKYL